MNAATPSRFARTVDVEVVVRDHLLVLAGEEHNQDADRHDDHSDRGGDGGGEVDRVLAGQRLHVDNAIICRHHGDAESDFHRSMGVLRGWRRTVC